MTDAPESSGSLPNEPAWIDGVLVYGQHDDNAIEQAIAVKRSGAERVVLCADGHKGYGHPIGCVAAYRDKISLSGVGFGIGCGVASIETSIRAEDLDA